MRFVGTKSCKVLLYSFVSGYIVRCSKKLGPVVKNFICQDKMSRSLFRQGVKKFVVTRN